jgi:hypothetical protein
MARGSHGQAVFGDNPDRQRFLETLGEACEQTGWQMHAYVLMGHHDHLLVEPPEPNLVAGRKWLQAHDEAAAERALGQVLGALGLSGVELEQRPKNAPEKLVLAWWLRQRRTVPLRWGSERLAMGPFTRVSQAINQVNHRPARKHEQIKRLLRRAARNQSAT